METIYYLSDGTLPFYIGKTKHSLKRRLSQHIYDAKFKPIPASVKKKKIQDSGFGIQIYEIECVIGDRNELLRVEQYWMWQFRSWGFPIINQEIYYSYPKNLTSPTGMRHKKGHLESECLYPFRDMDIGDSFIMNYSERMSVYSCLRDYNKVNGTTIKIQTAKEGEEVYRCWRVE